MEWYRERFKDKTVLVTGTSSGIGRAATARLLAEGATVIGADVGEPPDLDLVDGRFIFVHTDVRDDDAATEAVSAAVEVGGRLDGVVHAAGVAGSTMTHLLDREAWDRVISTNLTGSFVVAKAALIADAGAGADRRRAGLDRHDRRHRRPRGPGRRRLVQRRGRRHRHVHPQPGRRVRRRRSVANVLSPGVIETPMADGAFEGPGLGDVAKSYRAAHALRRFGRPEEVGGDRPVPADADASFVTGATITVDGGYLAGRDHGLTALFDLT